VSFRYLVLGAGRQGTAAAYDLVVRGEASAVVLADTHAETAERSAERLNALTGSQVVTWQHVDVTDADAVAGLLGTADAALSAVPYWLNLPITDAAIAVGTHLADLGGLPELVMEQRTRDGAARAAGVCIVPDCGQVPGSGANLMAYAVRWFDEPWDVVLYDGGIPLDPRPPWYYELAFNMDGLTNEYDGQTIYVIDGRPVAVDCFADSEYELIDFGEPFGTLEAFTTNGGTTTAVTTLGRGLRTLKNKTLRYVGHVAQFKAFRDAGFFGQEPITVDGVEIVPRRVFHTLIEPRIRAPEGARDVVLNRIKARGRKDGAEVGLELDVVVYPDEELGFTAMQQATGWHAAIVCQLMASGQIAPGVQPVELALDPTALLDAYRERGFHVEQRVTP
jgi:lysine 6-dehydrogenase